MTSSAINKVENVLYIDGQEVKYTDEKNILEVIRKAGFHVPTFCYRPDLTAFGACRMCVVDIEGRGVQSSCTMPPEPGLKVKINSEKTHRIRKIALELLLANHNRECTMCERSGSCELQEQAQKHGIKDVRFANREVELPIDDSNPSIVRDPNKCILCGACVRACGEIQGHSALDFANRGSKTVVTPAFNREMGCVDCVYCGQCSATCPTGALTIKNDIPKVWKALFDEKKTVVAQIAPAVRVAFGEEFGLPAGENTIGLIAAALKKVGFDKVFDTTFAADMTIMEEATEFLGRVQKGENLPLFTSCCPAWVRYAELKHPELLNNLSTCKSPQQMFGAIAKQYLAKKYEIEPNDLTVVSFMPCTAKKAEIQRDEFSHDNYKEVDIVLTTQELIKLVKGAGIDMTTLEPIALDDPLGDLSGAGVIFGTSGGVLEAALRTAYEFATGKTLDAVDFTQARGLNKVKEFKIDIEGTEVKIAVVNTLSEAETLIGKIESGEAKYDMVEVMACPGGCIGGAGQPSSCYTPEIKEKRSQGLYKDDKSQKIRKSHENPTVKKIYDEWLEKPNSHEAHESLHTEYKEKNPWK